LSSSAEGSGSLLERFLPDCQFRKVHSILIQAEPARVAAVLRDLDLSRSPWIRFLFALRGLPHSELTWDRIQSLRFCILGEIPDREFALGVVGQFWTLKGHLQKVDAEGFLRFDKPGYAKAVWHFGVEPAGPGQSRLHTETRIQCLGDRAYRKFRRYWNFIAPFSAFIRKKTLQLIRQTAEAEGRKP
jgi:hypothetical protein